MQSLTAKTMLESFAVLAKLLPRPVSLIVGGGGAMLMAHHFPLATSDVDAVPKGLSAEELKPYVEEVARKLDLSPDWLNPWFSSFTNVLPSDFASRLIEVFEAENLKVKALGANDLLLMKVFAHRQKDIAHARALVRQGANVDFVYDQIETLKKNRFPGTDKAIDFLDQIVDLEES